MGKYANIIKHGGGSMLPLFLLKIALHRCSPAARSSFIVPRTDFCPVRWIFLHFFLFLEGFFFSFVLYLLRLIPLVCSSLPAAYRCHIVDYR